VKAPSGIIGLKRQSISVVVAMQAFTIRGGMGERRYENFFSRSSYFIFSISSPVALTAGLILIYAVTNEILPRVLTAVTILIGIEYSLPPLRFKGRGIWGVIIGSVTQKPAIFVIFVAIISEWNWLGAVLTVWLFCGGLLGMLGHQILDYHNDLTSGVRTFVVRHGPRLALMLSIVCALLIIMTIMAPLVFVPFTEALPVVCLLAAFSSVYLGKGLRSIRKIRGVVTTQGKVLRVPLTPNR
jgi:4-hydroxybenzoate polyprenyltransferase